MGRHGATKGTADQDDFIRRHAHVHGQIIPGGSGIQVGAAFRRPALTPAKAAVVENQGGQAQAAKNGDGLHVQADIAGIAVAEQHHALLPGRRDEPGMQAQTIGSFQGQVRKLPALVRRSGVHLGIWMIDQTVLAQINPTGHGQVEQHADQGNGQGRVHEAFVFH